MMATERISVLVADDHPVFREAVGRALSARPEIELVAMTGDGRDALTQIRASEPSVAVIDQQLPSLSGLEILEQIQDQPSPTRVIIVSGDGSSALVYDAVTLGAAGFLTKASTLSAICDAVVVVAAGETVLAPEIQSGLVAEMRRRAQPQRPLLTDRETQVLRMIADGLTAPEIASRLFISASTVKTHVKNLFEKLSVGDRAAAVAEGMRRGLLE